MSRYNDEGNEPVEFEDSTSQAETALAVLVAIGGEGLTWVPKSQIHSDSEIYAKDQAGKLVVRRWWAEKAGLV